MDDDATTTSERSETETPEDQPGEQAGGSGDGTDEGGDEAGGSEGDGRRVVTEGPFEEEVDLSRGDTAGFLRDIADQLDAGTDLRVARDDWEVQFSFGEPIEVEVELDSGDERELEIELEFEE